ncbi:hypothetical protein [Umezawaea beigongshangensis]|uniref:hypothetical protein n=1 Tax=Umezawaea beigongshangensis TaxID=2780383 RepID=UPI0018F27088|nr:hypothetical protein [Umezawaea beigongshangensis]
MLGSGRAVSSPTGHNRVRGTANPDLTAREASAGGDGPGGEPAGYAADRDSARALAEIVLPRLPS